MPLTPTSFVPNIVKAIFQKYTQTTAQEHDLEFRQFIKTNVLIELSAIFGEELNTALRLLDEQRITIYSLESQLREVAEITQGRNCSNVIRLFPGVNYCTCDIFERHVLMLQEEFDKVQDSNTQQAESYTCRHVLAVQLATCFQLPVLRREILPKDKFNNLLKEMTLYEKGILKNLNMLTQSQYSTFKFVGRLDHIKTFYSGIKSLNFGENGSFQINEDGFRVTVENGKCIQANLYMTTSCFSEYHVDGIVNFSLNMNVITECLGIFSGIDSSMKMFYKGEGSPLIIVMEPYDEENITTECSIKTIHHEDAMDFSLDEDSPSFNIVFIRGPDLANIFHEIDKSAEELELTLSPRAPHFKIDTLGVMQSESSIEVAKTSDMMTLFNCRDTTKSRLKNSHLRMTMKALSVARKAALKTNESGLLEMHFMIQSEDQAEVYVQFFITPVIHFED